MLDEQNENAGMEEDKPKLTKSILSAIIYPIILIGIGVLIYSLNETSLIGLIISSVLFIAMGVVMFLSGFYFIIIPLPIIFLSKSGFLRNLTMGTKVLYTIMIVGSIVLAFVAMFILKP